MKNYDTRAWAEIDLDAVAHNVKEVKNSLSNDAKLMCVIKADAYGHGYLRTADVMIKNGADMLACASFEEAKNLRTAGITLPVLILGSVDVRLARDMVLHNISATITDCALAYALSNEAQKLNREAKIHIKIDTGMSRIGFSCDDEGIKQIAEICTLPGICCEGIFTHFSCADEKENDMTARQFERFINVTEELKMLGIEFSFRHVCNSAATINFPEYHLDMVRAGIILYGSLPDADMKSTLDLIPAMTVKARIVRIEEKEKGTPVSYGATFKTNKKTKIATVPIGYADGYLRCLSGNAVMSVNGMLAPVLGRICMDQCMIDVSCVNNINVGDEVIVSGNGGDSGVLVENLAKHAGTIPYEILSLTGNRIPRVYIKGGKTTDVLTYI